MVKRGVGAASSTFRLNVLGAVERTIYAAARAALINFTRDWVLEPATSGVTVDAVAPGPTATELFRADNPRIVTESVAISRAYRWGRLTR